MAEETSSSPHNKVFKAEHKPKQKNEANTYPFLFYATQQTFPILSQTR